MDQSPAAAAQRLAFNKRALMWAVKTGNTETVVDLLDGGVPIDIKDEGMSLLHWAAFGGHVTTMRLLIRRGCDVDSVDGRGGTPLHWAAVNGQTKTVRKLIKNGASTSVVAGKYGTPLHQAAIKGHVETAVAMLEEGCPLEVLGSGGVTVLHFAAAGGHVELVRELVDRGCDGNAVDASFWTPLHDAAERGRTEAVRELIKLGATKSVVTCCCGTPLHQAALKGHVQTAVAMLEEGCPLDVVNSAGETVLHFAAVAGNVELVRELVVRGCDVNAVEANGRTPLHAAAGNGRTEAICELIKLGATKSVVAGRYGTPLHQAALNGHVEAAVAMLEEGCPLDAVDIAGATVLHWAATGGNVELVKELVARGCDVNAVNANGCTPLHDAAVHARTEAVRELIKLGAVKSVVASEYGTPLHQAVLHAHVETVKLLLEDEFSEPELTSHDATPSKVPVRREELKGALATLITQDLVEPNKVLCLCAISGNSEDQFIELAASDDCAMPAAVKCVKYYFSKGEGVPFLSQLKIPDECTLNPLQMALLSMKCFEMGFAIYDILCGARDHTSFITKLLSHPVLKETVHKNFSNGLSPLDLARQFELHHIAALIEGAGGRPGVWADIPRDVFLSCSSELFTIYPLLKKVCDTSQGGHEAVKKAVIKMLGAQTVESVVQVADDSQLVKEEVLGQRPDLGDVVTHVLPHIQVRHWKRVGLALGIKKNTLNGLGQQFASNDDRYLETLSYWLEHGSSVTWKTLLDVLGHFETKHAVDELTAKIVSVLGGGHQVVSVSGPFRPVSSSASVVRGAAVAAERSPFDRLQTLDREVQTDSVSISEVEHGLWHPNAIIVGADVGPETDEHEYKSLMVPADKTKKPPPMRPCRDPSEVLKKVVDHSKEINAMLNHHTGGTVHFGIQDKGRVEEGLDLNKADFIDKLQTRVGQLLQESYPAVQSHFVAVTPVDLLASTGEPTGRWRFDICVKPYRSEVVRISRYQTVAYYRQGGNSEPMPADMMDRLRDEGLGK